MPDASEHRRSLRRKPWEIRAQVEIDSLRAMAARATPRSASGEDGSDDAGRGASTKGRRSTARGRPAHDPGPAPTPPPASAPPADPLTAEPWRVHLLEAEGYLNDSSGMRNRQAGTRVEGAWGHIEAARVEMVRWVFDDGQLCGMAARLEAAFTQCLDSKSPERRDAAVVLKRLAMHHARRGEPTADAAHEFDECERETLATALQAANSVNAANYQRLRRFQGKLIGASIVLLLLVLGLVAIGIWRPHYVPLCFPDPDIDVEEGDAAEEDDATENGGATDDAAAAESDGAVTSVVCPSTHLTEPTAAELEADPTLDDLAAADADERAASADVFAVVLFGLIGASLTSVAFVIRPAPPTTLPVQSIRVFQAIVKAETGVLAAVLGLLFLRAGVVPGFTQVDTRSQILVYAVVFGASQQVLTRLIDARSDSLLGSVKSNASPASPDSDDATA